jgi:cell division protein FtsW (lipid II flippase)
MNFLKKITVFFGTLLYASSASAQLNGESVNSLFKSAHTFLNQVLIPFLTLMALAYTVYAVVGYIQSNAEGGKDNEEKKKQIIWGIIGLFVIVSIWGLVAVVGNTFGTFAGGVLKPR